MTHEAKLVAPSLGTGIRIHAGLPGSGKSYAMQMEAHANSIRMPVIAYDRPHMNEWGRTFPVKTFHQSAKTVQFVPGIHVVKCQMEAQEDDLAIAIERATNHPGDVGIAVGEAHMIWPKYPDKRFLGAATEWRHRRLALWLDSQRLSLLSTDVVEISRSSGAGGLRIFATGGEADLFKLQKISRRARWYMDSINEQYSNGIKGWFVDCVLMDRNISVKKMRHG